MQWGQIKTIFILCFLILDIFLLHQIVNNSSSELPLTEDYPSEENVRNNVNGLDNLPEEAPAEVAMLYAQRKEFSLEEQTEITQLPNQRNIIIDDHMIVSQFDESFELDVEENPQALSEYIWNFDSYQYFAKDEDTNTFIFFQHLDRPIYFNLSGVLLIHANENGEAVEYVQTILEKADEDQTSPEEMIAPFAALSGLYFSDGYIVSGDVITDKVKLGYHNLLGLPNGVQVLAPTWEFEVNKSEYYYVNAIEGHNTTRETGSFISDMKDYIEDFFAEDGSAVINTTEWDEDEIQTFLTQLLEKQEKENGVE